MNIAVMVLMALVAYLIMSEILSNTAKNKRLQRFEQIANEELNDLQRVTRKLEFCQKWLLKQPILASPEQLEKGNIFRRYIDSKPRTVVKVEIQPTMVLVYHDEGHYYIDRNALVILSYEEADIQHD